MKGLEAAMIKMSLQMIEIQKEVDKLKSTNIGEKYTSWPNEINKQELIEETEHKAHEEVIIVLKATIVEKMKLQTKCLRNMKQADWKVERIWTTFQSASIRTNVEWF